MFGEETSRQAIERSPDFITIEKQDEDGAKMLGIDQIRQLIKSLSLRAWRQPVRVVAIYELQQASEAAQNALLKTLEEPPQNTVIIITCPHPKLLLPTIVSRCQIITLPPKERADTASQAEAGLILSRPLGYQLDWVEENREVITSQSGALRTFEDWLATLRKRLLENENRREIQKTVSAIRILEEIRYKIENSNASPRLGVEVFLSKLSELNEKYK